MNRTFKIMMMSTFSGALMASCSSQKIQYPDAPTDETVVDEYFGTKVPDKFRPLENDTAPATLEWVKAENAVTEEYLSKIPFRDKIKERLLELNNYKKTGLPSKHKDGKYYFYENDGLQNQSVLYRTDSLGGTPEVFLDQHPLRRRHSGPSGTQFLQQREICRLHYLKKRFGLERDLRNGR